MFKVICSNMSKITSTYLTSDYSNSKTIFLSAREPVVQNQAVFLVSTVCLYFVFQVFILQKRFNFSESLFLALKYAGL